MIDCLRDARVNHRLVLGNLLDFVIKVVTVKERLYRSSTQLKEILFELLILEIFPLFFDVFLVKVVFKRWDERGF